MVYHYTINCVLNPSLIQEMSHAFSIKTMWRSFFCALMATMTLSAMNPFRTGKLVLFQITYDRDWHFFEILFFVILGIFGVRQPTRLQYATFSLNDRWCFRVCMVHLWLSSTYRSLLFEGSICRVMVWQKLSLWQS